MGSPALEPPSLLDREVAYPDVLETLFGHVMSRATAKVRYDDPRVPSLRAKLLQRVFRVMPASRMVLCRHFAETTFDYMEIFLAELKAQSEPPRHSGGSTSMPKSVGPGDGSVLAELLVTYVEQVCVACSEVTPDTVPEHTDALTKMTELLTMAMVHLCRARPVLDTHFEELVTCIRQLVAARPHVANSILRRLLQSWPRRDSTREVSWICLVQTVLLSCPAPTVCCHGMHLPIMRKLIKSLRSLHASVARQALQLVSNMYVMLHYILPYSRLFAAVREALVANRRHWNDVVVQMSDQQFENMLDLS